MYYTCDGPQLTWEQKNVNACETLIYPVTSCALDAIDQDDMRTGEGSEKSCRLFIAFGS